MEYRGALIIPHYLWGVCSQDTKFHRYSNLQNLVPNPPSKTNLQRLSETDRGYVWLPATSVGRRMAVRVEKRNSHFCVKTGSDIFMPLYGVLMPVEAAGSHMQPLQVSENPLDPTWAELISQGEGGEVSVDFQIQGCWIRRKCGPTCICRTQC